MFDTVVDGDREEQVKLWTNTCSVFQVGEAVGAPRGGLAPTGTYTVCLPGRGFLHVRAGMLIAWARGPGPAPFLTSGGWLADDDLVAAASLQDVQRPHLSLVREDVAEDSDLEDDDPAVSALLSSLFPQTAAGRDSATTTGDAEVHDVVFAQAPTTAPRQEPDRIADVVPMGSRRRSPAAGDGISAREAFYARLQAQLAALVAQATPAALAAADDDARTDLVHQLLAADAGSTSGQSATTAAAAVLGLTAWQLIAAPAASQRAQLAAVVIEEAAAQPMVEDSSAYANFVSAVAASLDVAAARRILRALPLLRNTPVVDRPEQHLAGMAFNQMNDVELTHAIEAVVRFQGADIAADLPCFAVGRDCIDVSLIRELLRPLVRAAFGPSADVEALTLMQEWALNVGVAQCGGALGEVDVETAAGLVRDVLARVKDPSTL